MADDETKRDLEARAMQDAKDVVSSLLRNNRPTDSHLAVWYGYNEADADEWYSERT